MILKVLRSTLCQAPGDVAFTQLFSAGAKSPPVALASTTRAEPTGGNKNRAFFLDHDSELIETIVNFLRSKKIEDPFDPIVEPPVVPEHKHKDFRRLLNYFGLTAFFYYPSTTESFDYEQRNGRVL